MKYLIKAKTTGVPETAKLKKGTQSGLAAKNSAKSMAHEHLEKELNAKILEVTMKIKDHFPELLKYLDEIPITILSEKNPQITLSHLNGYYESLNSILNKYKLNYPKIEE
jgi:hypothetical protein